MNEWIINATKKNLILNSYIILNILFFLLSSYYFKNKKKILRG